MPDDILIVDDEADIRELVSGILQDEGYITRSARDSDDALAHVASRRPNLVFLDIWLQGSRLDGLQLLDALKAQHPELPIVMISGHGNIETAVAAIKQGAYDFIEKPFKADRLVLVTQRALETSRLKREVKALKQLAPSTLVGKSSSMNQLRQTIEKISPTNSRILIVGPAGAGKELTARAIHSQSARADGRRRAQSRCSRGVAWRHVVRRRDRRHAARDPEQDLAGPGRADVPARRRHSEGAGRRAHHFIDRPQHRS